jgi:outer membrane protein assembly factor BamB
MIRPSSHSAPRFVWCSLVWLLAVPAWAQHWNQFRGANTDGVVTTGELLLEWSADQHILWKIAVPGSGWSQPVVWGDRIFVTTAESDAQTKPDRSYTGAGAGVPSLSNLFRGDTSLKGPDVTYRWKVLCLDASTGGVLWEQVAREGQPTMQIHPNNTYATETPVTDGERVIAYFGMAGVYAYDATGKPLWSKDLGAFPMQFGWGTGSSPVLFEDYVFLQCDNDRASFLVALDKQTGEEAWRVKREELSNWSTPYVWRNKLRTELVTAGGHHTRSYDPRSGKLLWHIDASGRTSTTPVGDQELLFVDSYDRLTGRIGAFTAIRPGGDGEIVLDSDSDEPNHPLVAWSRRLSGSRVASPTLYQSCLYVPEQQSGVVRCLDAATGKEHYRKRVPGASGFTASPLANQGRIFLFDQNCVTTVVEAGAELKILAKNDLGEMCWGSPAIIGERLLVRTLDHLYCIGRR